MYQYNTIASEDRNDHETSSSRLDKGEHATHTKYCNYTVDELCHAAVAYTFIKIQYYNIYIIYIYIAKKRDTLVDAYNNYYDIAGTASS